MARLGHWVVAVRDVGVADQPAATVRRIRTINIVAILGSLVTFSYCAFYTLYDASYFATEILFLLAMGSLYPTSLLATRADRVELAMWMLIVAALFHIGIINWLLGPSGGALSYLFAVPFILTLITREDDHFTIWPVALAVGAIFFVVTYSGRKGSVSALPETVQSLFFLTNVIGAVLFACVVALIFRWFIARAEHDLETEKARSDRLLRAILPEPVAEQLKSDRRRVIAERYAEATTVFADIVGFTRRSAKIDADQVVTELNRVFGRIDDLAQAHAIEKIKTIGDAYFAVCGLPEPVADHAERVADFALDLSAAAEDWAREVWPDLRFRIAVHSGPVVAGVIGRTKFAYDVWGDTINTAARLEGACEPGEILITEPVRAALPSRFETQERGEVALRDVGQIAVHRLVGREGG